MATAKIELTLGSIAFSGEGEETWVSAQLDKILERAPALVKIVPQMEATSQAAAVLPKQVSALADDAISSQTLSSFLRARDAKSGLRRFLATAVWLHARGSPRLSTGDVTKALRDSNQSRLTNASDCLSKNVSKGYIERDGKRFFVTDEGKESVSG